jgi:hypothetical protein
LRGRGTAVFPQCRKELFVNEIHGDSPFLPYISTVLYLKND